MLLQRVQEAQRIAIRELKDQDFDGKTVDSAAALEAEARDWGLPLAEVTAVPASEAGVGEGASWGGEPGVSRLASTRGRGAAAGAGRGALGPQPI
jgi:hypothetical protein